MLKYALYENTREYKYEDRMDIHEGCTIEADEQWPDEIEIFDNLEDALEALKGYKSYIHFTKTMISTVVEFTEYIVEARDYNDDDDPDYYEDCEDSWTSDFRLNVCDQTAGKVLATFDNFYDADDFVKQYIKDYEEKMEEKGEEFYDELELSIEIA